MDTNVVDKFLRGHDANRKLFAHLKREGVVDFLWSLELVSELAANRDLEGAKASLRIAEELCGIQLFVKEPKLQFRNEAMHVLTAEKLSPFVSRAEARQFLRQKIWDPVIQGRGAEITAWLSELKKRRFKEEREEYDKMKANLAQLGLHSKAGTFEQTWEAAEGAGWIVSYMREMIQRQCDRVPAPGEVEAILRRLPELRAIRCFALHQVAYFHFVSLNQNRPEKHGNNIDARHIIAASNADIFITDDSGINDQLRAAQSRWPFKPMTSKEFCDQFSTGRGAA